MHVPFISLDRQYDIFREDLIQAFDEIGSSGQYIMGDALVEFESSIAEYCDSRYALGIGNGSDALFYALKALGLRDGDEVITCPNSFIASAWVIEACNAKTVFVDCDDEMNIDVTKIEAAITPNTKAILPIHLTGRPASMDEINAIASKYDLAVVEDAAQAIGATYKGRKVGSLGDCAGFSLHPLKNLGVMGDGGVFTTNSKELYEKVKLLRNHGLKNRDECEIWGYNSRLDNLQAKIALIKLSHLDKMTDRFIEIAEYYHAQLQDFVLVPSHNKDLKCVYHNFVIRLDQRDSLQNYLLENGVESKIHYPIPIHMQKCASNLDSASKKFPVSEKYSKQILSLPIYPELSDVEVEHVTNVVKNFFV